MIAAGWIESTLAGLGQLRDATSVDKRQFGGACHDSRRVEAGQLFLALPGERSDGHRFAAEALKRGAAGALLADGDCFAALKGDRGSEATLFLVEDVLNALQSLAAAHLRAVGPRVVAVTGSNGKTGTKELCRALLETLGPCFASAGNYNNLIGLPMTLLSLAQATPFAVLEMGCSSFGEIARLCELFPPQIGVVTNIGAAHLEELGDLDGVARAKGELPAALPAEGLLVLNGDDAYAVALAARSPAPTQRYGFGEHNDLRLEDLGLAGLESRRGRLEGQELVLANPYRHGLLALGAAWSVARHLGGEPAPLAAAAGRVAPAQDRGRLRRVGPWLVLDDSYNANPQSMAAALDWLGELDLAGRRWAVLGDMLELGESGPALHGEIGARAARLDLAGLLATGPLCVDLVRGAATAGMATAEHHEDMESLLSSLKRQLSPGDLILIKGSRGAAMERVLAALEKFAAERNDEARREEPQREERL